VISVLVTSELVPITDDVVIAAAWNEESGKEMMALLLDQRGDKVKIIDDVVKAAAGNYRSGKEVIALLLDQRGDKVKITDNVVIAAAGNYSSEVMALLLDRRGDEVRITDDVVKAAVGNEQSGKEVMIILLEQREADVQITDEVISSAATAGQGAVLQLVNERLNVVFSKEKWFSIAQFYNAAKAGDEDMIRSLFAQRINPDLKNIRNVSPLWQAATEGHLGVVEILLNTHAVDVNSRSIFGRPPIFWAAALGHKDVVKLLLKEGANPALADKQGQTPLSMAKQYGHDKVVQILGGE
jgi:hypothetical protein